MQMRFGLTQDEIKLAILHYVRSENGETPGIHNEADVMLDVDEGDRPGDSRTIRAEVFFK